MNAVSNALFFKKGISFRCVIVLAVSSLESGRGKMLADVVLRLENLFGANFSNIFESTCLVITKVNSLVHSEEAVIGTIEDILN